MDAHARPSAPPPVDAWHPGWHGPCVIVGRLATSQKRARSPYLQQHAEESDAKAHKAGSSTRATAKEGAAAAAAAAQVAPTGSGALMDEE